MILPPGAGIPGVTPQMAQVIRLLASGGDPYEVGLAADWGAGPVRVQLSYNPRRHLPGTRPALVAALSASGFDVRTVHVLMQLLPHASVVVGLEDEGRAATLYLEELERREPAWRRAVDACTQLLGGALPELPGNPYILAVDLQRGKARPVAWKFYWHFLPEEEGVLFEAATRWWGAPLPAKMEGLRRGCAPEAWMLQLRFGSSIPSLKIYKTWAYHPHATPGAAEELEALGAPQELAIGKAPTSVGVRAQTDGSLNYTAYWCLARREDAGHRL
ncbi:MAG TPA: hypothetical protein PKY30_00100 [Myxococcota bacterium]|nr:hypothetical protein [Myxococcota bacterium]HNH45404.1 hypothetical protein [Myxococcota bacterium]